MFEETQKQHLLFLSEKRLSKSNVTYKETIVPSFNIDISQIDDLKCNEHFYNLVLYENSMNSVNKIISDIKDIFPLNDLSHISYTFKIHHYINYYQYLYFKLMICQMKENMISIMISYIKIEINVPTVYTCYIKERCFNFRHKDHICEYPYYVKRELFDEEKNIVKKYLEKITSTLILFIC
jgi:hypothetical protein